MTIERIWATTLSDYHISENNPNENSIRLNRATLIIGANNSGKSRFLRKLFSSNINDLLISHKEQLDTIKALANPLLQALPKHKNTHFIKGSDLHSFVNGEISSPERIRHASERLKETISNSLNRNLHLTGGEETHYFNAFRNALKNIDHEKLNLCLDSILDENKFPTRHYIPMLRGMRPLSEADDLFTKRTIKDYFSEYTEKDLSIITGFNLYQLLARFLLGQPEDRAQIRAYEKILGEEFFGGADVTLIPEYGKDTISVKIGDDKQFPIYDLGDGLQQVIIITSAAFLQRDNSIYFIEEPEICLHPGLLRKLATFLLNHTNHYYFIATHSNHLLDLSEANKDISVYKTSKFRNTESGGFQLRECTKDRDLLLELGVYASSIYLSNSTIWVEGITDRLYIKSYMSKFLESLPENHKKKIWSGFLENYHYTFVEYQGGTLGHWNFDSNSDEELDAQRLCSEAILIVDGDIKNKGDRHQKLTAQLGDRLITLSGKEIENTLPQEILIETASRLFDIKRTDKIGLYKENISSVKYPHYSTSPKGIGHHLDRAIGITSRESKNRGFFSEESGTIKDKLKFCRIAIDVMSEIEWNLPSETMDMCEKIFSHIEKNNH